MLRNLFIFCICIVVNWLWHGLATVVFCIYFLSHWTALCALVLVARFVFVLDSVFKSNSPPWTWLVTSVRQKIKYNSRCIYLRGVEVYYPELIIKRTPSTTTQQTCSDAQCQGHRRCPRTWQPTLPNYVESVPAPDCSIFMHRFRFSFTPVRMRSMSFPKRSPRCWSTSRGR